MASKTIAALVALSMASATAGRASDGPAAGAATPVATSASQNAARRFPQPVRAGDLAGRRLLGPQESQPVLGHVVGVSRRLEGAPELIVRTGGVFGLGSRLVAVPIDAVALLGEHVALMDLTPEQLAALPSVPEPAQLLQNETIRVGLAKPFH